MIDLSVQRIVQTIGDGAGGGPFLAQGYVHIVVYALHDEVKGPLLISRTRQARSQLSDTEPRGFGVLS